MAKKTVLERGSSMCVGIKAGKLLQYFGASRRLESNNSASFSALCAGGRAFYCALSPRSRENLHEQDVVIERKGMIFTSDAKNFKHLRENERYDCPLCLMAAMQRGVEESEIQMHGKKNECVAARGERGRQAPGKF